MFFWGLFHNPHNPSTQAIAPGATSTSAQPTLPRSTLLCLPSLPIYTSTSVPYTRGRGYPYATPIYLASGARLSPKNICGFTKPGRPPCSARIYHCDSRGVLGGNTPCLYIAIYHHTIYNKTPLPLDHPPIP